MAEHAADRVVVRIGRDSRQSCGDRPAVIIADENSFDAAARKVQRQFFAAHLSPIEPFTFLPVCSGYDRDLRVPDINAVLHTADKVRAASLARLQDEYAASMTTPEVPAAVAGS